MFPQKKDAVTVRLRGRASNPRGGTSLETVDLYIYTIPIRNRIPNRILVIYKSLVRRRRRFLRAREGHGACPNMMKTAADGSQYLSFELGVTSNAMFLMLAGLSVVSAFVITICVTDMMVGVVVPVQLAPNL